MMDDTTCRFGRVARRCAALIVLLGTGVSEAQAQMPGMPEMKETMSWGRTLFVLFDELEYAPGAANRPVSMDAVAWYGGAYNRVWVRVNGDQATTKSDGEAEAQVLYGRLVDPFWDAVVGVRLAQQWGDDGQQRVQLAVGFLGLAPYRFELEPTLYVSHRGELSARIEAAYQFLLTQRLVAEPELELNAALQAVPRYDIARGLNDYEVGVRVRYEFRREIAPYAGMSWSRRVGGATTLVRERGEAVAENRFVVGLRLWR